FWLLYLWPYVLRQRSDREFRCIIGETGFRCKQMVASHCRSTCSTLNAESDNITFVLEIWLDLSEPPKRESRLLSLGKTPEHLQSIHFLGTLHIRLKTLSSESRKN